ncbi:hypothetical protein C8Q75DRAFT_751889 [Abortiporus biennis]|nr:hypothetical protein C8Q75DRAFT_751889 [Abortiporus biennis]
MSTFTPVNVVEKQKEKDWAANLGMLDWDTTRIVFTKRSLIEFLKYTGTTVDTSYHNIQKLPRYAKFGKIEGPDEVVEASQGEASTNTASASDFGTLGDNSDFKPSRRVRTAPGGETHDIFGHYVDDDALANAPARSGRQESITEAPSTSTLSSDPAPQAGGFRPTRRVREMPGGKDSISDILG